jgi:ABC-type transporter Mla maintaining outer membrane lipid asymmetry ATPase subunit MlaF
LGSTIRAPAKTIRRNMCAEYSAGSAPVLRTEHLGCKVEGKTIANDVSVEIWRGEVMAIVEGHG